MPHVLDHEQEKMWESVNTLSTIQPDLAKTVLRATLDKSIRLITPFSRFTQVPSIRLPNLGELNLLHEIERKMYEAKRSGNKASAYEHLVEFIEAICDLAEEDPIQSRKKMLSSLLMAFDQRDRARPAQVRLAENNASKMVSMSFYKPSEVGEKLGLSSQTIRRMCEKGKFEGAYQTEGGHWRIPTDAFITTAQQDDDAAAILNKIDERNRGAGDVDEFDL